MSDSDRIRLAYADEGSAYGTAPTGAYQIMRVTNESLHQETSTITSAELRSDRQIPDVVRSNLSVAGDVGIELSYSFDDWFKAGVMSAGWSSAVEFVASTLAEFAIDADGGSDAAEISLGGSPDLSAFSVGMWIHLSGFGEAGNNGYFKITAVDDTNKTIDFIPNAGCVDEDPAPVAASVELGGQVVNGTTMSSYSIEKAFTDNSNDFALYKGCVVDSLSLNVSTESVVTGAFTFLGATGTSLSSAQAGSYNDANTLDVMNSIDDVTGVLESSSYVSRNVTAWSMALANNLRPRLEVGTLGAVSIGTGTCNVTGTLQAYYSNATLLDKHLNFLDTALAIVFEDVDGNSYVIDCPKVIYTSGQRVAGGQNQDIIADLSWEAVMHDTEGITVRIVKFDA